MTYAAKILADSIDNRGQARLTSMEITFPRFILAEFNTHRVFSRNSASSRAIPVKRRIAQVWRTPFVPEAFGVNKSGMQASATHDGWVATATRWLWLLAARFCCVVAWLMMKLNIHKQHANRVIELWAWHTVVVTSTEWQNFFSLRTYKAAQPEMQIIAKLMQEVYDASEPRVLHPGISGLWHLPYVTDEEWAALEQIRDARAWSSLLDTYVRCSVVRCAAVSYERQDALRPIHEVHERHDGLAAAGHWSPFEHQAYVTDRSRELPRPGNFRPPWTQYRKTFQNESVWKGGEK